MIGLILKDFLNLRKQMKIYLILIIFYLAIGMVSGNPAMLSSMMAIVAFMIPITALSYDERSKWDRYALTMPLSRSSIVVSKYILGLIFLIMAFIVSILSNLFLNNILLEESMVTNLSSLSMGLILMSIIFPIIFKMGVEKGRVYMMLVLFIPTAFILLLSKTGMTMPNEETIKSFFYVLPVISVLMFTLSILISVSIYNKKEF